MIWHQMAWQKTKAWLGVDNKEGAGKLKWVHQNEGQSGNVNKRPSSPQPPENLGVTSVIGGLARLR